MGFFSTKVNLGFRFFNNTKPLQKTQFYNELGQHDEKPSDANKASTVGLNQEEVQEDDNSAAKEKVQEDDNSAAIEGKEETTELENSNYLTLDSTIVQQKSKSPYCLFSSNKLACFKSKFDPSLKNSAASGSQFKPVMSSSQSKRTSSQSSIEVVLSDSQRSSIALNSIDTDSLNTSQQQQDLSQQQYSQTCSQEPQGNSFHLSPLQLRLSQDSTVPRGMSDSSPSTLKATHASPSNVQKTASQGNDF